jgi:tetratricopeptide (TPR) repeat protein
MANNKRNSRVRSSSSAGFSFIPYTLYLIPIYLALSIPLYAQRSEVNDGVDQYKEEKYSDAEVNFKKGKEKSPENFEAQFNLGDAYYKQGRYDESLKEFYSSIELTENPDLKAKAYHNIGNSLLKSQKLKESVEAYKNALKINPNDQETKYNLSYALNQLEKQQNQQQQNQQNQDQNKDKNKDQNQDQNKDKNQQQNNKNEQKQDQDKPAQNEQTQQDNTKAQQQQQNQISKEEAERILQALKNNEQDIQKKIRKKTGIAIKREKDW